MIVSLLEKLEGFVLKESHTAPGIGNLYISFALPEASLIKLLQILDKNKLIIHVVVKYDKGLYYRMSISVGSIDRFQKILENEL